jgi:3-oxoacyl-[acyl-carrier-protein] synthase I
MGGSTVTGVLIVGLGLSTPLGLTTAASQCAIGAGLARFRASAVNAPDGEPVRAAFLPQLSFDATRAERIQLFAEGALRDCLGALPDRALGTLPVHIALPEAGRGAALSPREITLRLANAASHLDWSPSPRMGGRAGFLQALQAAVLSIASQRTEAAVVVGMDSYCDRESLRQLAADGRVLSARNPDGLIPGEGAGALLIATATAARRAGLVPLATVEAVALARDTTAFELRQGGLAYGLTQMLRQLGRGAQRVDAVLSCQPGEGKWARELSVAHLRNAAFMPEPQRRFLVANSLGDLGAAAAPVQVGMLAHLAPHWRRRGRPLQRAVIYGAADGGDVGGCIVSLMAAR